jgi:hypothetical protein
MSSGTNPFASLRADLARELSPSQKALLSGGFAGTLAKTITAPLSRITILYQVSSALRSQGKAVNLSASLGMGEFSGSVYGSIAKIVKSEGAFSLWKGNLTSVIHRFPYSATNFSVYETTMASFKKSGFEESSVVRLVCGALGGGVACFVCYPLDLLRTRFAVMDVMPCCGTCSLTPGSIAHTATHIVKHEGFSGLYKGCSISIAVSVPNIAMGFTFVGKCKELFVENGLFVDKTKRHTTPIGSAFCGAIAGSISSSIVFPIDVLRRRLQVTNMAQAVPSSSSSVSKVDSNGKSIPSNLSSAATSSQSSEGNNRILRRVCGNDVIIEAQKILRTHGVAGFYRGIAPELMKGAPNLAILFCVYDMSMQVLKS